MDTFLATLLFFAVIMLAMALGLVSGRSLKGSCGGVQGKDCSCSLSERRVCRKSAGTAS
jgi:hypothetical protein